MINKNKTFIFFLIWSLWLSAEFLLGPYSHVRVFDNGDSLLPQLIASKIQFQKYGINYFSAFMVSGVDGAAQGLVPFSNLISALFIVFPAWLAYGLSMFVQRFLASYFTYRLARESLKLNIFPSIIAALLFSLFNFSIYSFTLYHSLGLPALPFIIWSLERILRTNSPKIYLYLTVLGIFVGFSNYFVYFSPYLLPFIFFWFIYVKNAYSPKIIFNLIIFSLFSILPMVPNILAVLLNLPSSQRTVSNLASSTFYPQGKYLSAFLRLAQIFVSFWPSFLIILVSLVVAKTKDLFSNRLLITSLALTLVPFAYKSSQPFLTNLPALIRSFSFDRVDLLIPFALALAAASLLNSLPHKNKSIFVIIWSLLFVLSFKIKLDTIKNYAPYRSLYEHPDLVNLAKSVDSSKWRVATITGGGARPSYALASGLSTVDTYLTIYPKTYHKYWSEVIRNRISGDKLRYEDFIDWGNRVYLYGPNDFDSLEKIDFEKYYDLGLLSQANVKYIISTKPVDDPNLILLPSTYRENFQKWQNFKLSEKFGYFLSGKFYGRPLYIYENKIAYPRFFLEVQNKIIDGQVKVRNYSPDKIEITINDVKAPSVLIGTINYYPYWQATVNGNKSQVKKFQDTFLQVEIPTGRVEVILKYKPPYAIL